MKREVQRTETEVISGMELFFVILSNMHSAVLNIVRNVAKFTVKLIEYTGEIGIFSSKCTSNATLHGKTAVITGSNSGIGKVTAKDFFRRGARVIMACRNLDSAKEAMKHIEKECENIPNCGELLITELDLSSLESVRKCAKHLLETENKINLLINNAGIMMCPYSKTEDGHELQFGTNHLGHFLLTILLLPKIIQSTPARIVTLSSMAHEGGKIEFDDVNWETRAYSSLHAYTQSKLANILFSRELARRLEEADIQGVNTYSLHPGVIATNLGRHLRIGIPGMVLLLSLIVKPLIKTPEQGSQTTIYCAIEEKCESETGLYYANCKVKDPSQEAKDDQTAKRLWDVSMQMVNFNKNYDYFQKAKSSS